MLIQELLNSKVDYEVTKQNASTFKTSSEIGCRTIVFSADLEYAEIGEYWNVYFEESTSKGFTCTATGSGDEFKVLSMVKASLAEFVHRYKPSQIYFSAAKEGGKNSRPNVYKRLVQSVLSGYKNTMERDDGREVTFFYRKN